MTPLTQLVLGTPGVDGSGDSAPVFGGKINTNYGILEPAINALEAITAALGSAANQDVSAFSAPGHGHVIADVTGLQSTLDLKADLVAGVIPTAQLPALAVTDYVGLAANEALMLALPGEKGDWCIRSDLGTTWVIVGNDPTLLTGWQQLSYPTAPVTSVNGQAGAVVLGYADVGAASPAQGALADSALQSIVADLTPQLGGDLDLSGNKLIAGAASDVVVKLADTAGVNKLSVTNSDGVEVFKVGSNSVVTWDSGFTTPVSMKGTNNAVIIGANQTYRTAIKPGVFNVDAGGAFQWTAANFNPDTTIDLRLLRDEAGTLALKNGFNAQTYRIYNTFTDGANYERLSLTGAGVIAAESAGTGAANIDLTLMPKGTGDVAIAAGFKLTANRTTEDAPFINFEATIDADAISAISSWTTSGAVTHHVQISLNGMPAWIPVSTIDPTP